MSFDVLVVGGVFREVFLHPTGSPTIRYGGSGLTAAIVAAKLGSSVALASYVGRDDSEAVIGELDAVGVDARAVQIVAGASGTFLFPEQEEPSRPWPMYRPAEATPRATVSDLPHAAVVLAFGIPDFDPLAAGWLDEIGPDSYLIWDRQGWLSRIRSSAPAAALPARAKFLLLNASEAADELDDWQQSTIPQGFDGMVIKQGADGVTVADGSPPQHVAAFPTERTSTVGSGDVFAGAVASRIATGDSLLRASVWGCAAAASALDVFPEHFNNDAVARTARRIATWDS